MIGPSPAQLEKWRTEQGDRAWSYIVIRWSSGSMDDAKLAKLCRILEADQCKPPKAKEICERIKACELDAYDAVVIYHDQPRADWLRAEVAKIGATVEFASCRRDG
jgi:hypothetical protein